MTENYFLLLLFVIVLAAVLGIGAWLADILEARSNRKGWK